MEEVLQRISSMSLKPFMLWKWEMVGHDGIYLSPYHSGDLKLENGSLRPNWAKQWIQGWPGIHSKTTNWEIKLLFFFFYPMERHSWACFIKWRPIFLCLCSSSLYETWITYSSKICQNVLAKPFSPITSSKIDVWLPFL